MYTVPPFSASLISLMDSVDVKHHVYLLGQIVRRPGLAKRYGVSEAGGRFSAEGPQFDLRRWSCLIKRCSLNTESRSCVKVEVAVLCSLSLIIQSLWSLWT